MSVTSRYVLLLAARGDLKSVRIGQKAVRFRPEDVKEFIGRKLTKHYAPVSAMLGNVAVFRSMKDQSIEPAWFTLQGAEVYSSLNYRTIRNAVKAGLIETALARMPGAKKGRRLVSKASMDFWIASGIGDRSDLPALDAANAKRKEQPCGGSWRGGPRGIRPELDLKGVNALGQSNPFWSGGH